MDRDSHVAWLRRELDRHDQPCWCMDCGSARGELLYIGEHVDGLVTVQEMVERSR